MSYEAGTLTYEYGGTRRIVSPIALPSKEEQTEIFAVLKNGIKTADIEELEFDEITEGLTKHPEKWFQFSDENGLDVPIGLEGASRTVQEMCIRDSLDADLFHNIFWTACIQESIRNPVTAIYAVYVSAEYCSSIHVL